MRATTSKVRASAVAAFVVGLAVLVGVVDPSRPGRYPTCPVRALTGLACPGCGSLRALHALVHGDLLAAVHHNAVLVAFLPFAAATWLRILAGRPGPAPRTAHAVAVAWLVLLVGWSVIRNLPWPPSQVLGP